MNYTAIILESGFDYVHLWENVEIFLKHFKIYIFQTTLQWVYLLTWIRTQGQQPSLLKPPCPTPLLGTHLIKASAQRAGLYFCPVNIRF